MIYLTASYLEDLQLGTKVVLYSNNGKEILTLVSKDSNDCITVLRFQRALGEILTITRGNLDIEYNKYGYFTLFEEKRYCLGAKLVAFIIFVFVMLCVFVLSLI